MTGFFGERRVESLPVEPVGGAPDDWVLIGSYAASEAEVVRGLLESSGVRSAWEASGHSSAVTRAPAPGATYSLYVSPDDADAVRELLGS